jgi:hypothetical protein
VVACERMESEGIAERRIGIRELKCKLRECVREVRTEERSW